MCGEKPHVVAKMVTVTGSGSGALLLLLFCGVWYSGDRTAWGRWWGDWNLHSFSFKPKILPLFIILILFKPVQTGLNQFKLVWMFNWIWSKAVHTAWIWVKVDWTIQNWLDVVQTGWIWIWSKPLELIGSDQNHFEPVRTVLNQLKPV